MSSAFTTETHLPAGRQEGRREKALRFFDLTGEVPVRSKASSLGRKYSSLVPATNTSSLVMLYLSSVVPHKAGRRRMRFAFLHQLPLEERLTSSLKKSAEPMGPACNIWPGPVPSLKHSKKPSLPELRSPVLGSISMKSIPSGMKKS